jgi:hypothetical protein
MFVDLDLSLNKAIYVIPEIADLSICDQRRIWRKAMGITLGTWRWKVSHLGFIAVMTVSSVLASRELLGLVPYEILRFTFAWICGALIYLPFLYFIRRKLIVRAIREMRDDLCARCGYPLTAIQVVPVRNAALRFQIQTRGNHSERKRGCGEIWVEDHQPTRMRLASPSHSERYSAMPRGQFLNDNRPQIPL